MADVDVLVVGAGPVGLTAAAELRRHGVGCRIVDRLAVPKPYAKAIGVLPRTLEVWDTMGLVRGVLDHAVPHLGQLVFIDGKPAPRVELTLSPEIPYPFATLPQSATERLLAEHLAGFGTEVERATELRSVEMRPDEVEAVLAHADGRIERLHARYVVGCDGAHSLVRKAAGLTFEGDAFPEQYMIGDVEVDWELPAGYSMRAVNRDANGAMDDMLVCIPMPGVRRYWLSMLRPGSQAGGEGGSSAPDGIGLGLGGHGPDLGQIQAVLDRLAPEPTTASTLRWSSAFRTSHRMVDRYRNGRLFVAGDAAHIHPPIGGQGLNTGVQDAYNLAWKLALTVRGLATDDVLESYHAERHPVAQEVVGRTVHHARTVRHAGTGLSSDGDDAEMLLRRQAQLLVAYPDSPLVQQQAADGTPAAGPAPGDRAPDCRGLLSDLASYPRRLFDLLRTPRHVLLLFADSEHASGDGAAQLEACAAAAHRAAHGLLDAYLITAAEVPEDARPVGLRPPRVRDAAGEFRDAYAPRDGEALLIRPDGYLSGRFHPAVPERLTAHLRRTFA
ncbi:FAD-dependent monooxygenase [Streptomyces sp. NBC_01260]|uniref:FAD-dependent monooxygenase n=1 Tax=unclassified Streptomyces TaxID=2593676 RepID=UPI000F4A98AD|nr:MULTISPECIES: FAD-dependent monooxygenase [unclassified Streptomyces]MCX4774259.1 FAD-dependent monooxygenase [Streptomyces sp. NBC_01285]ROQ73278.1 2-polyprenyl-6-methoxyphenol hydroxylase-like FAD-dependent oxidoreductase [Streptomyces sp. CEV 2-1]RPK36741.1 Pentachlorophenol 4-monooxygenase [Streptomyces sp. ADI92-24]